MYSPFEALAQARREIDSAATVAALPKRGVKQAQQKAVSSTSAQYAHGPSGLFNQPGVNQNVYSTIIRPLSVSALFPMRASQEVSPLFQIITEQLASSGTEPTSECGTALEPGALKQATLTAPFGRIMRKTANILMNRVGQIVNRGEPLDTRIMNDITGMSPWIPDNARTQNLTSDELAKQFWQLGLEFERVIERMMFSGNPATQQGSAPDYGYKEFAGFSQLINTGKIDALTGVAVAGADPQVINWNSALVSGTATIGSASGDIVQAVSSIFKVVLSKAQRMGMLPGDWVLAMTPDLYFEISRIWPCSYLTNGCSTSVLNGATQFVSAAEQVQMRDEMRGGSFLWVLGSKIPVYQTDAIPTSAAGNGVKSDIYLIPRSQRGEFTTYLEYFDENNPQIQEILGQTIIGTQFQVSNGGLYLWTYDRDGFCFNFTGKTEPRLILRTPWLSGRISNVVYNTGLNVPSAFPGDLYPAPGGGAGQGGYTGGIYAGY